MRTRLPLPREPAWKADQPYKSKPKAVRQLMAELRARRMVDLGTLGELTVEEALLRAFEAGTKAREA